MSGNDLYRLHLISLEVEYCSLLITIYLSMIMPNYPPTMSLTSMYKVVGSSRSPTSFIFFMFPDGNRHAAHSQMPETCRDA